MADITMCVSQTCQLVDNCYRCHAPINDQWQSMDDYTDSSVVIDGVTECPHFIFYQRDDNGTKNTESKPASV